MKALDSIKYLTGADFIKDRIQLENKLKIIYAGTDDILSLQCDEETQLKIYSLRAETIVQYPLVLLGRLSGINSIYKRLRIN